MQFPDTILLHAVSVLSNYTDPSYLIIVFENSTGTCFVYIPVSLAQVARFMSKEVCLYAGADWLKLKCQRVARVSCKVRYWCECETVPYRKFLCPNIIDHTYVAERA